MCSSGEFKIYLFKIVHITPYSRDVLKSISYESCWEEQETAATSQTGSSQLHDRLEKHFQVWCCDCATTSNHLRQVSLYAEFSESETRVTCKYLTLVLKLSVWSRHRWRDCAFCITATIWTSLETVGGGALNSPRPRPPCLLQRLLYPG